MGQRHCLGGSQLCLLRWTEESGGRRSLQGHTFTSIEVPRIMEPLRIASALTLAAPDDGFRQIDATDEFKRTMAQWLNGVDI